MITPHNNGLKSFGCVMLVLARGGAHFPMQSPVSIIAVIDRNEQALLIHRLLQLTG